MTSDLSNPHDRFFKEIWSHKDIGQDFLRHYLPAEVLALLDLNSLQLTKDSFVDRQLRQHYSDLLYKLQFRNGASGHVYLLLEHKRAPERLTAFQLLRYMVRIGEKALARKGVPPPVIPVVLYHGDTRWPYGQTLHAALEPLPLLAPYTPDFRYVLCDLSRLTDVEIGGAVWLRVSLLLMKYIGDARLAERLPGIFRLLRELVEKSMVPGYLETLLHYLASAAEHLPEEAVNAALNEVLPDLEERYMATLAQKWFEEGRQEGRQEALTEGIQTGERRLLRRQLELRFGPLPAGYAERITTADSATLLLWSERLLSAQRLQEIFEA